MAQGVLVLGKTEKKAYSVILPTFNEKENIGLIVYLLVESFRSNKLSFEILVVDDNSPDGTAEAFMSLQRIFADEQLLLLKRPGKLGLGSAYMDALEHTNGDFIFLMDADLSHHPKYIPDFIAEQKAHDWDVVSGTRYRLGGSVCGWDAKRILVSRVANYLAKVLLAPPASDLTGSYRLYKREVLQRIMSHMRGKGYVFQMEIMVVAKALGNSVGEVPIAFVDRIYGESKLGASEIAQYVKGLLRLFWTI